MNRPQDFDYGAPGAGFTPPVAVFARSAAALARVRDALQIAGAAATPLDPDNLRPPAWIELDGLPGPIEEDLVARLDRMAGEEGLSAVVVAPREALDVLASLVSSPRMELLIAPHAVERAAAAAMLVAFTARPTRAREAGRAPDLRELSEEVSRIAQALAQLSDGRPPGGVRDRVAALGPGQGAPVDAARVHASIRERRLRSKFFDSSLFADPAWDMLLDLFSAELSNARVPVSSLCAAAEVPPTTALRWIRGMTTQGLFERRPDPTDARRVFIALSPAASAAMTRYFAAI